MSSIPLFQDVLDIIALIGSLFVFVISYSIYKRMKNDYSIKMFLSSSIVGVILRTLVIINSDLGIETSGGYVYLLRDMIGTVYWVVFVFGIYGLYVATVDVLNHKIKRKRS